LRLPFLPLPAEEAATTEEVEATEEPAAEEAATGEAQFTLTGLVENELAYNETDLRELEVVEITAEHPKKGPTDYEGVRLSALLDLAVVDSNAKKLVLTASDGFSAEVFLNEVLASPDCLLAFTDEEGVFNLVMPDLPSTVWVKNVIKIEIQ